ncbi:ribulose bisphosphate carboxylase/oxygenase activase, chloroplastic isoform X2 [Rhododendron vialii]|uniref:ribulose bisphosphate carboxylase/oxygenase activase, chloroplastic isoform X2 n=1 Tax=Rhododendron vialii TaxID=182163 RepID=UPI00266013F7|nr:ribulose bisphosphate carboxylase/oxygenase activase, chloroplastic isoform X2 [Rhododendron vialii]
MALFFSNFNNPRLISSSLSSFPFLSPPSQLKPPIPKQLSVRSVPSSHENENKSDEKESSKPKKRLSEQSSWEAKDSEGEDYLYRLGKEADNMNIAVGARAGVIDDLFAGNFLGRDSDIVFDYRQKVTRSFEYLQGDYYIAPVFMVSAVCHIVKNYISHLLNTKIPLILGIWGGKGQGKSFQTELIFQAMGVEPVIMSAGELESERAGEPGKLIRDRYRTASQVVQNKGKMSCLMINDIDAGLGRFGNTQMTVNNQIVVGTLMNLCDNPTRVSIGQDWRESDVTSRIPIIVTGNDFSTIYAPLIRDGRMEKFYWQPTHEDIINIVHRTYERDGISRDEVESVVNTFPNQALDFYGALRSRTYDSGSTILEVLKILEINFSIEERTKSFRYMCPQNKQWKLYLNQAIPFSENKS